jgi:hypothetical protein
VRGGTVYRRRLGIAAAGFFGGAIVLAIVGLAAGWAGYAVGQMALAGAGSGLLLALGLVGALEDGEVQRATDRAVGTRTGPADR